MTLFHACDSIIGHSEWLVEIFLFRFLIKPGCHLCDHARPLVTREVGRRDLPLLEVDVGTDADLLEDYGDRVPVLLAPDGVVIAEGRIDERSLRRSMRGWRPKA